MSASVRSLRRDGASGDPTTGVVPPQVGRISTMDTGRTGPRTTWTQPRISRALVPTPGRQLARRSPVRRRWWGESRYESTVKASSRHLSRQMVIYLSLLVCATTASGMRDAAVAAEGQWAWFSAGSTPGDWFISRGHADVSLTAGKITARLLRADGTLAFSVVGVIKNGRVDLTARQMETDSPPTRLQGTYRISKWRDAAGGREAIVASDREFAGGLVIGLSRDFAK